MTETLPKRRLKNFDFSGEGAHVALISKEQGGAANGWHTAIITKATKDVTTDYLQKATMVNVTLPFDDFLERFFGIWEDDADTLTKILGFSDEEDDTKKPSDMSWEEYKAYCEAEKQAFIDSVHILKSVKDGSKALADLSAKEYLSTLLTQSLYEGHEAEIQKALSAKTDTTVIELRKSYDAKLAEQEVLIRKATADLQAANAQLTALQAQMQARTESTRLEALKGLLSDEEAIDMQKSTASLSDEAFAVILKSLRVTAAASAQHMGEIGSGMPGIEPEKQDPVRAAILARIPQKENK